MPAKKKTEEIEKISNEEVQNESEGKESALPVQTEQLPEKPKRTRKKKTESESAKKLPSDETESSGTQTPTERTDLNDELDLPDRILTIEAKAEENVKSKSLASFVKEHNLKGVRCSMKPYIDQGWMENIPLYAAGMFTK